MGVSFLKEVVHEHHISSSGRHFSLGQFDEGIEHDFGPALAQLLQRETDLLRLQLVVLSQDVDECTALRPLPAMISDVSGGVQGRTVASAVEKFGFPLQSSLTQVKVLRAVVSDTVDVKLPQLAHQFRYIPVGHEHGFLREAVKLNSQTTKRFEHAVQDRLIGLLKGIQNGLIAVFARMNERTDRLFDVRCVCVVLTTSLSRLVPSYSLVVGFLTPLWIDGLPVAQKGFNLCIVHVFKRPSQHSNLLPHVVDVVLGGHIVPPQTVESHQRVAQNGVPCPTDVKGAVWIGRRVFDQDLPRLALIG